MVEVICCKAVCAWDHFHTHFSWVKAIVMQFFKTTAAASASATHIAVVILFCASWVLWKIYSIFQSLLPMECWIIFYVIILGCWAECRNISHAQ